jgi:porin
MQNISHGRGGLRQRRLMLAWAGSLVLSSPWAALAATADSAPAAEPASSQDPFTGKTLTGDWGGRRSELHADGIDLRGSFIDEAMGVVHGGLDRGARNAYQTQVGVDLDMGKLTSFWGDGRFHLTVNDRRGLSTSNELGGNDYMPIQEIYSDQFTRLSELSYDQNFFDRKLNWKAGYYVFGNDFGINQIMTNFVNAALCAHPISLSTSAGWTNWPRARWATHVTWHPTEDTTLRAAMVLVNTGYNLERNRWRLDVQGTTGHLYPVEFEWAPRIAGQYPGHYKVGYYYDTSDTRMVGDRAGDAALGLPVRMADHREGGYAMFDQKVTRNAVDGGLSLFLNYTAQSQQTAVIHRWASTGFVYQGLFASRPQDRLSFGYVRASVNRHLNAYQRLLGDAGAVDDPDWALNSAEQLYELAYGFQVRPWLSVRPDLQYVVKPGAFRHLDTANVLAAGVQVRVAF